MKDHGKNTTTKDPLAAVKFILIPLSLFVLTILAGALAGWYEVHVQGYSKLGLSSLVYRTIVNHMGLYALAGQRILVFILIFALIYLIAFRKFRRAYMATAWLTVLWICTWIATYFLFSAKDQGSAGLTGWLVALLNLENFVGKGAFAGFRPAFYVLWPIQKPIAFVLLTLAGLPFGLVMEFFLGRNRKEKPVSKFRVVLGACLIFFICAGFLAANAARPLVRARSNIQGPNIVVVSLDSVRADALGAYGNIHVQTPLLDRIARNGATFMRTYANSPWTLPSVASTMTGMTPPRLGIEKLQHRLGKPALTLAEILSNFGYSTGAVTTNMMVGPEHGFDQGFDQFIHDVSLNGQGAATLGAGFLQQHAKDKFFLYVQVADTHWPYRPPLGFASLFYDQEPSKELSNLFENNNFADWAQKILADPERLIPFARAMYDAQICATDTALKPLFEKLLSLDLLESTVVVVISDHGENFGEGGMLGHGLTLNEASLKVPFIVSYPRLLPKGTRIEMPVQLVDLAPTLLAMANILPPVEFDGRDLTSELFTRSSLLSGKFLFETSLGGEPRYAVIEGRAKYITPYQLPNTPFGKIKKDSQIYDLLTDPKENNNQAGQNPELLDYMKKSLAAALEEIDKKQQADPKSVEFRRLTPQELDKLKSFGYGK